jgi:hypothetical protein
MMVMKISPFGQLELCVGAMSALPSPGALDVITSTAYVFT